VDRDGNDGSFYDNNLEPATHINYSKPVKQRPIRLYLILTVGVRKNGRESGFKEKKYKKANWNHNEDIL